MDRRRRAQAVAAGVLTLLLTACANDPSAYPHGNLEESETDGSLLRTLAIYVLLPALILGVLAAGSWVTSRGMATRRYRPQEGWSAAPVWFAGPSGDAVAAVEQAQPGDVTRGGTGGNW